MTLPSTSVLVLLLVVAHSASAQTLQTIMKGRDTLRGVSWLDNVLVESVSEEAERDGLTRSAIQTDVELRLRQNRVPFSGPLDPRDASSEQHEAFLYVSVQTLKRQGQYAWTVEVSLYQRARLTGRVGLTSSVAEGAALHLSTWTAYSYGTVGVSNLRMLRDEISDQLDKFINDWLAVH